MDKVHKLSDFSAMNHRHNPLAFNCLFGFALRSVTATYEYIHDTTLVFMKHEMVLFFRFVIHFIVGGIFRLKYVRILGAFEIFVSVTSTLSLFIEGQSSSSPELYFSLSFCPLA
jgi:hypothetical protein